MYMLVRTYRRGDRADEQASWLWGIQERERSAEQLSRWLDLPRQVRPAYMGPKLVSLVCDGLWFLTKYGANFGVMRDPTLRFCVLRGVQPDGTLEPPSVAAEELDSLREVLRGHICEAMTRRNAWDWMARPLSFLGWIDPTEDRQAIYWITKWRDAASASVDAGTRATISDRDAEGAVLADENDSH